MGSWAAILVLVGPLVVVSLGVSVELWDITDRARPRPLGQPRYRDATRTHVVIPTGRSTLVLSLGHTAEVLDLTALDRLGVGWSTEPAASSTAGSGRSAGRSCSPEWAFRATC